tara:strand:+ start:227 stop:490 length:264 start_codon:yes stop_codon:yes gene_type:complete
MKLLNLSIALCFLLCSCGSSELTPEDAAQQACECMKLSKDGSEAGLQAFKDCNSKTTEMISDYRENAEWMAEWRTELMKVLKECMSE